MRPGVVIRAVIAAGCLVSVSVGQRASSQVAGFAPFAKYVPSSANLFLTVGNLDEVDRALERAHAWQLLSLMAGNPVAHNSSFNLQTAFREFLGRSSSVDIAELMNAELAVLSSSWPKLGSTLWLVRLPREEALEQWFPQSHRTGRSASRSIPFFRTDSGLIVCAKNGFAAVGRPRISGSLLRDTINLMVGRRDDALEQSPVYRELAAYLPARPLAVAYLQNKIESGDGASGSSKVWPRIRQAIIGMYEGEGRIDFAIRSALEAPRAPIRLSPPAVGHFMRLPETTLLALATAFEFDRAFPSSATTPPTGTLGRVVALLAGFRDPALSSSQTFPRVGPRVIVAWGQDLSKRGATPQVAILVECDNAQALNIEVEHIIKNILRVIHAVDPAQADMRFNIRHHRRLGTRIASVPFRDYAEHSQLPLMRLLARTELAWAAWGDWFVCALSREHIEQIIDAYHGLLPTLATVSDVQTLRRTTAHGSLLAVLRASLAADVLDRWLRAYEAGAPSLLDPSWWEPSGLTGVARQRNLGIGMRPGREPGVVVVDQVYPGTPADGRMQPKDRILGVDGKLLNLTASYTDLRRRLAKSDAQPGPTLRVLRQGVAMDIIVPRRGGTPAAGGTPAGRNGDSEIQLVEPADAVRELALLGRSVEFASFAVLASEDSRYSARLSLRFVPPPDE